MIKVEQSGAAGAPVSTWNWPTITCNAKIGDEYKKGDYVFEKSSTGDGTIYVRIAQGFKNLFSWNV